MDTQHNVEELFTLAFRDDLTGLYNRRYLNKMLVQPLEERPEDESYCFLLMDIDFFKEINDTYGHRDGDRVLISVAELLGGCVQDNEVAIRYAGDEFVLLLPNKGLDQGLQKAIEVVEKGRTIQVPQENEKGAVSLTFSVGVASFPENGDNWEQILEKADEGLYAAKQKGRDQACLPPEQGSDFRRGDDLSRIFPCPQYIGRQETVSRILNQIEGLKSREVDRPAAFLSVMGGRGSGKTRLLTEVGEAATENNNCVLHLKGSEQMQKICYGSLIQGLLHHAGTAEKLRERIGGRLAETDEQLWETFFSSSKEEQKDPVPEQISQDFFSRFLEGLGSGRYLVFLLDDADLLDRQTVNLLDSMGQAPSSGLRFFALAASTEKSDEAPHQEPASVFRQNTAGPGTLSELSRPDILLVPLGEEDVERMTQAIFPTLRLDPSFWSNLYLKSLGNPLFVEEALKYLVQTEKLAYQRSAWNWLGQNLEDLPDTLESLLEARLAALDPALREILGRASVMGPDVEPDLLKNLEGVNEGYVLDLLDKARKFGLLDSGSRWQDKGFRFNSKTARDITYNQVSEEDRTAWHLQMAELQDLLGKTPGHLQMGPMLYHYQMAGQETQLEEIKKKLTRVAGSPGIILPSSFVSKKNKSSPDEPVPLLEQEWGKILSIFHLLRAAVQTARLNPETSQAVTQSCERLHDGFEQAFLHTPSVHLSEAEGTLLVNGDTPSWKGEEKSVADNFCKSLSAAGLKDISFSKGIDLREIKEFLSCWISVKGRSADVSAVWETFESKEYMEHIRINAKVYVAVSDADLFKNGFSTDVLEKPDASVDELTRLLSSLQSTLSDLKTDSLQSGVDPEQASHFRNLLETIRDLMASGQTDIPAITSPQTSPAETSVSEALHTVREEEQVVEKIEEQDVRCSLADILSGDPKRESNGYRKISEMGECAVEPLYFALTQSDDAHEGRICARFLKNLCPDLAERTRADIERSTDAPVKKRLLQYLVPVLENEDMKKKALLTALQQDESMVVMEALHQLETEFTDQASPLLLDALPLCHDRAGQEICAVLGRLGDPSSVPRLLDYLDRWKTLDNGQATRFHESVCHALGYYRDPEVAENLGILLGSCSKLPWRKFAPLSLRKAALKALERIGGETALSLLKHHETDKDPWIRHRAKNVLRGRPSPATAG